MVYSQIKALEKAVTEHPNDATVEQLIINAETKFGMKPVSTLEQIDQAIKVIEKKRDVSTLKGTETFGNKVEARKKRIIALDDKNRPIVSNIVRDPMSHHLVDTVAPFVDKVSDFRPPTAVDNETPVKTAMIGCFKVKIDHNDHVVLPKRSFHKSSGRLEKIFKKCVKKSESELTSQYWINKSRTSTTTTTVTKTSEGTTTTTTSSTTTSTNNSRKITPLVAPKNVESRNSLLVDKEMKPLRQKMTLESLRKQQSDLETLRKKLLPF